MKSKFFSRSIPDIYIGCITALENSDYSLKLKDYDRGKITASKTGWDIVRNIATQTINVEINIRKDKDNTVKVSAASVLTGSQGFNEGENIIIEEAFFKELTFRLK